MCFMKIRSVKSLVRAEFLQFFARPPWNTPCIVCTLFPTFLKDPHLDRQIDRYIEGKIDRLIDRCDQLIPQQTHAKFGLLWINSRCQ